MPTSEYTHTLALAAYRAPASMELPLLLSTGPVAATDGLTKPAERVLLSTHLERRGSVVRPDQGNDGASEGRRCALLITGAAGYHAGVGRIRDWTRTDPPQPDGLLAFRAGPLGRALSTTRPCGGCQEAGR